MANEVANADIKNCYHKVSLRRIFLKPEGMGSPDDSWKEACFTTVSFGDVLGSSTAQLAISDCADKFMGVKTRKSLCESIYG